MLGIHGVGRDKADYYLSDLARELPVAGPGHWVGDRRGRDSGSPDPSNPMTSGACSRAGIRARAWRSDRDGSPSPRSTSPSARPSRPACSSPSAAPTSRARWWRRTARRSPARSRTWSSTASRRSGGWVPTAPCWRPAAPWRRSSPTGSAATATRISTAMSSWPTSSMAWTVAGVPATDGGSTHIAWPHPGSTRRTCGPGCRPPSGCGGALGTRGAPAEIAGMGPELLGVFSSRGADIRRHMYEVGARSGRGARVAWAATRPAKAPSAPFAELADRWRRQARDAGVAPQLELPRRGRRGRAGRARRAPFRRRDLPHCARRGAAPRRGHRLRRGGPRWRHGRRPRTSGGPVGRARAGRGGRAAAATPHGRAGEPASARPGPASGSIPTTTRCGGAPRAPSTRIGSDGACRTRRSRPTSGVRRRRWPPCRRPAWRTTCAPSGRWWRHGPGSDGAHP